MEDQKKKRRVNSKKKGSGYELQVINLFKELGFVNCTSTRLSSRELDNLKVDIYGLDDFNVQCKAVEATKCLHTVLESMPQDGKINVVFHKKNRREPVIAMHQKDFLKVMRWLIEANIFQKHLTNDSE